MSKAPIRIAIMVSGQGRGSNMQSIIDSCKSGKINGDVVLVLGVKDDAPAMERARDAGIKTLAVAPKNYSSSDEYDSAVYTALCDNKIDLICLAGYMRLLGKDIVTHYSNRIMNVHPALIPMFAGKGMYGHHVHEAAIERGVKVSGATVHFVNEDYDKGPIILQTVVPVENDDTPDTLAARVLIAEHETYSNAIALFADNKLKVINHRVRILSE